MGFKVAFLQTLKWADGRWAVRNRLRGLPADGFDIQGEKVLDWGWCAAHLPHSPRRSILDIGCAQAPTTVAAIALGHEVTGVDTDRLLYHLPGLTFYQADFLDCELKPSSFDIVILCSVVEHIGLVGRYDQHDIPDGDLRAMKKVIRLLKPEGELILTIPVGKDLIFAPWHRIYGPERLPRLLQGFSVLHEGFLVKDPQGPWHPSTRDEALHVDRRGLSYALGQFVLAPESRRNLP